MSLKIREFIYGTFVGLLLFGGFIMGKSLQNPQSTEAYMGRGGPFSACGVEFSQGHDSYLNGVYSFNYYIARSAATPLNTVINLQTKTFRCFCPGGLNPQGYCLLCDSGTIENRTLASGTSDLNIPISMNGQAPYCGGYQMDVAFLSVNGNSSSCNTLKPDGSFNGGVWGIWDVSQSGCITPTPTTPVNTPTPTVPVNTPTPTTPVLTPTPTTPVLTPTPTTPVLTPTPTIPVNTPTPTTPVSTPTPTIPVVSGTPTPTPTTPVTTGTPTPTTPVSTGTPTPTPTSPAENTPTPTPNTACVDAAPSAIRNLKVSRLSPTSVKLTWDKPETGKVTDNAIRYRLPSRDFEYSVPSTGDVTDYAINDLSPNTDYCFSVYAKNNCAPGPSTEVCTGGGQVLGSTTLPPTSSLPLPSGVILATFYTFLSAGMVVRGWAWMKNGN